MILIQLQDVDSIYNPEISDNRIDTSFPPASSYNKNSISEKPFIVASSSTPLSTSVSHIASNYKTTSKPAINYNNKTFELITTTSKKPRPTTSTTEQYTVQVGGFTTTLGTIIHRNVSSSISLSDETSASTTEGIKLTTFQSIQDFKNVTDRPTTKSTTTTAAQKTKKPATKPTVVSTKNQFRRKHLIEHLFRR